MEEKMRKARLYSETGYYHVVIRGVNKQNIFYDNFDRKLFLNLLKKYGKKLNVKIHAFCLMDNHVHLELQDLCKNISIFMQTVCSVYARFFNRKYDRIGHLFQERFASEVIRDNSYFITVLRYILQNPIQAGITNSIDYEWSSYKLYKAINSFVEKGMIFSLFPDLNLIKEYVLQKTDECCLEIELRPSEKFKRANDIVKGVLEIDNIMNWIEIPIIELNRKIHLLKEKGLSIRTISRITGIPKRMIEKA